MVQLHRYNLLERFIFIEVNFSLEVHFIDGFPIRKTEKLLRNFNHVSALTHFQTSYSRITMLNVITRNREIANLSFKLI